MSRTRTIATGGLGLLMAGMLAACGTTNKSNGASADGDFANAPSVTFNLAYPFAADHHVLVDVIQPWLDDIEKRTEGTVKFEVHPGGALADPEEVFELTAAGAFEAGLSLPAYTPGQFPLGEVIELPFMFTSAVQATEVYWQLMDEFPEMKKEYADVVLLALIAHDPGELFTSDPIREPEDVKGLKIRTPGAITGEMVSTLGGSPVSIAAAEIYDSLDRGIVDGYMTSRTGVPALGLEDITKHATLGGFYAGPVFLVMNKDAYGSLTAAQKAIIDEQKGRQLSLKTAADYDAQSAKALKTYATAGVETYELVGTELDAWRARVQPVVDRWVDRQEDAGLPAKDVYDRMMELRE